tara:strand:+ start:43167 stop:44324 length:1158 start_codon:yes stop_codon:yes gene_type:complete
MDSISFDIWSILIIIALAQGLFVLSILPFKLDWTKRRNYFLLGIILVLIWLEVEFLSVRKPFNVPLNIFYGTRHGLWMLLGPLFYFYAQFIYKPNQKLGIRTWIHFLPFLLITIIIPFFNTDILNSRQVNYGMLTAFDSFNDRISPLQYIYSSVFVFQFIHLSIYLLFARKVVKKYRNTLKNNYSNIDVNNLKWLHQLSMGLLIILIFATVFLFILFYTRIYRRHLDYLYVLPMSYVIYLVSYKLVNISWKQLKPSETKKYTKSSLDDKMADEYAARLSDHMITNKPYLNTKLRLAELAKNLEISPHHLSQIINEKYHLNFYDFINKYRVNEIITILKESNGKEKISLLDIAYKTGFNNKTSFTNSFKKFTGQTPSSFKSLHLNK